MQLGTTLKDAFGGEPGWLARGVPRGQFFDFDAGRVMGPAGDFVRSPSSRRWIATGEASAPFVEAAE